MLNRRLWILFIAFFLGFLALGARLAKLQLVDADQWHDRMQQLIHREDPIETYRGTIVDRNGLALARDVPSDELAIDFRAMNLDDSWLDRAAIEQLHKSGKWTTFASKQARNQFKEDTKADIADQISTMPERIAAALAPYENVPADDITGQIVDRLQDIRKRVAALRQDAWFRRFDKDAARARATGDNTSSTGENAADVDDSDLDAKFQQLKLTDEVAAHTIRANIAPGAALYFKQHIAEFPGLLVRDAAEYNRREYPFGEATAHVIGTLRSVTPEAMNARKFQLPDLLNGTDDGNLAGYLPGDRMGENGIESLAENQLHGVRGARMIDLSDASTQPGDAKRVEPAPGQQVQLTLDASLQRDLWNAINDPGRDLLKGSDGKTHFAALVVMSLDGQVLSLISYPSYDPNALAATRAQLNSDTWRKPLNNRALKGTYPPGSTVKPLLAAAGLTEKVMTPDEEITCLGHLLPNRLDIFRCDRLSGHGPIALRDAIAESCDVYFYTIGQRLGIARLRDWYGKLGFGHDTGFELGEEDGTLPSRSEEDDQALNDSRMLGIGQGPIAVTPLQMANAYATLLRGGVAIPPRILASSPAPQTRAYDISPTTLALVREGMVQVVTEGTGKTSFSGFNLRVAGKTGTAEIDRIVFDDNGNPVDDPSRPILNNDKTPKLKPDGTPAFRQLVKRGTDAWFVGYAPANNPRFVVAAVMEWGGHGGTYAAPMVREAFVQLERHNYLPATDVH